MVIYRVVNKINGKQYIGQTVNPMKRWSRHCSNLEKSPLSLAIQKYGKENFSFGIIAEYSNEIDLNNAEDYYIDFNNCICPNGYNRVTGQQKKRQWSAESLKKASESKLGLKNPMYGKPLSAATKELLRSANKGKPKTEAHKEKLRQANLGKKASAEARLNMSLAAQKSVNPGRFKKGHKHGSN